MEGVVPFHTNTDGQASVLENRVAATFAESFFIWLRDVAIHADTIEVQ